MDLKDIKENYNNFDDYTIEKIATEEAQALRPEVLEILKDEIRKRNLSEGLIDSVNAQTKIYTEKEITEYCDVLRKHTCPKCNSKTKRLNVSMIGDVFSIIVFSRYSKNLRVACSDCLDELNKNANVKSALLGWWGFPWGPIYTIKSFIFNHKMKKMNNTEKPNDLMKQFVLENIGVIESGKTNPEKLTEILKRTNRAN